MTVAAPKATPFELAWTHAITAFLPRVLQVRTRPAPELRPVPQRRWDLFRAIFAVLLVSAIPGLVEVISTVLGIPLAIRDKSTDYPLALVLTVLNVLMLAAASIGFRFINNRTDQLKASFRAGDLKSWLSRFVEIFIAWPIQVVSALLPAIAVFIAIVLWSLAHDNPISVVGGLFAVWTSAIGGLCLHWMLVFPIILHRLLRAPSMRLVKYDPASTEWIRIIARVTGLSGLLIAVLALALGVVYLTMTVPLPPDNTVISLATNMLVIAVVVLLLVTITSCGVPAWQMTTIITTAKRLELRRLDARIQARRKVKGSDYYAPGVLQLIDTYRAMSDAPDAPFSTPSVVQYVAVVIGAVLALLFPVILRAMGAQI